MTEIVLVGFGGFIGSILRYLVNLFINSNFKIPLPTLTVNLIGSFLVGMLLALPKDKISPNCYLFLSAGFLGGFTTYSAFSGEVIIFLSKQQHLMAFLYISASILGGLLFCYLGLYLVKQITF